MVMVIVYLQYLHPPHPPHSPLNTTSPGARKISLAPPLLQRRFWARRRGGGLHGSLYWSILPVTRHWKRLRFSSRLVGRYRRVVGSYEISHSYAYNTTTHLRSARVAPDRMRTRRTGVGGGASKRPVHRRRHRFWPQLSPQTTPQMQPPLPAVPHTVVAANVTANAANSIP